MYGPGCWTRAEILKTPAAEILQHIVLSRRADAHNKTWALNIASYPKFDKRGQRSVRADLKQQAHFGRRFKRATEQVNEETRVLIIGCELMVHGDRWARINPEEMAWLREQGIDRAEAIRRHEAWMAKERQHPFWTPAAKKG